MRLSVSVGEYCQEFLDTRMVNLKVKKLQVDEIWTFVGKKQKQLTLQELDNRFIGDQYVFYGMDADTKLIPSFRLAKRDGEAARSFMTDLATRIVTEFQLTTDAFSAYNDAVDSVWGAAIHYAQIHKSYDGTGEEATRRYSPPNIIRMDIRPISGNPNPRYISTSYIERGNLTMRMQMRRFTRLTNAYSKKWENLKAALALYFWHYNFARVHESLRVTPAMEAGLTKRIWTWEDLLRRQQERKAA